MFVPTRRSSNSNHRRRRSLSLPRAPWILTILLTAALPACAQGRDKDRGQAELHIRVHVVRVVAALAPEPTESAGRDGIVFSVPYGGLKMNETEQVRLLTPIETLALRPGESGTAVLRTRTIVLP